MNIVLIWNRKAIINSNFKYLLFAATKRRCVLHRFCCSPIPPAWRRFAFCQTSVLSAKKAPDPGSPGSGAFDLAGFFSS